jgi:hypothetical protein
MAHHLENINTSPVASVTGRQMTLVKRAFTAADLVLGAKRLVEPTVVQAAALARISRAYAGWAVKRMDERLDIERVLIPLVPSPAPASVGPNGTDTDPMKVLCPDVTGTELAKANGHCAFPDEAPVHLARAVGVDRWLSAAQSAGI